MQSSKLLINEPPLQVLPSLAKQLDVNKAIILQQIQYWIATSGHSINGQLWIYNSYTEWSLQFPWLTARAVRWHIKGLEEAGFIVSGEFNRDPRDNTKWYRIDYAKLEELLKPSDGVAITDMPPIKKRHLQETGIDSSLTENTTENTIDNLSIAPDWMGPLLNVIDSVKGFKEPHSACVELFYKIRDEFPEIQILAELKAWSARKLSEPITSRSRPLGQIWNWMRKADEFRKERGHGAHRRDNGAAGVERLEASIGKPLS